MRKIKVLHIITRLDPGGSTYNTLETAARLDKDRYEVTLVSGRASQMDDDIKQFIIKNGINCTFVDQLRRAIHPLLDCIAFFRLVKICREGKFDIVHTHSSKAGIVGRWAAHFAKIKYIVHTPHGHVFHGYFNPLLNKFFILLERSVARLTDKIITLTHKGKEDHLHFKIAPKEKFVPIYSGINIERIKGNISNADILKEQWGIKNDEFVFGTVARLDPIKGNEYLIRAFAKIARLNEKVKLILVGDGTQREFLKTLIEESELKDKVVFTGFQQNVASFIDLMDVFVLSSLNEGMGRAILEAMVAAKPVIASRTGGVPELVEEGETGFLVDPKDVEGLADRMKYYIEHADKLKEMGRKGAHRINERFSIQKMVSDIDRLYQDLMEAK